MTISEEVIPTTMRLLARGYGEDPAVEAGESAVPGLAALLLARDSVDNTAALGLNPQSRVLIIGTEGATDPEVYWQLVGLVRVRPQPKQWSKPLSRSVGK